VDNAGVATTPQRVREHPVQAGDLRLSVRDHEGTEPAVVGLHGLASNARWWDLVASHLAPRRLVSIDQRGHGLSDKPDAGYDFDSVTADARSVIRALALGPVVAAGHSWGASVALWWAAADPEGVRAVVCVDGGIGDLRGFFGASWDVAEKAMRPPRLDGITASRLHGWVDASGLAGDGDVAEAVRILSGNFEEVAPGQLQPRLHVDRHMQIARELYHLDTPSLLARVTQPVLLVVAVNDQTRAVRQSAADEALSLLPRGSEAVLVDGIHDLPVQRPAEVAAAMTAFFARAGL
jgi:pimeloyl-ACP methyl ester carboxylesterase